MLSRTGGAGADTLTGGDGADTFAYTADGQTLTTADTTAVDLANADEITDFAVGATDLIGFLAALGDGGDLSFGAQVENIGGTTFASDTVSVVTLDETTLDAGDAGAEAAEGNAALLVFNTSGGDIDAGADNDLSDTGLGANADLQIIGLQGQTGVNYGDIAAADFDFAFA